MAMENLFKVFKYSPDQPRDSSGRWTSGSGASMDAEAVSPKAVPLERLAQAQSRLDGTPTPKKKPGVISRLFNSFMDEVTHNSW